MTRLAVLATDGSPGARTAEEYLARTLRPDSTRVTVVSVVPEHRLQPGPGAGESDPLRDDPMGEDYPAARPTIEAENRARDAAERLGEKGFEVDTVARVGDPGSVICELAQDHGAHQILMGRRGQGTVRELLLGSVSQFVIHHASCPVTLVPESS